MKYFSLFFLALLFSVTLNAQDPTFEWATSTGGPQFDEGHSIATDSMGNVYITGHYSGTVDFDPGPAVFNLTSYSMFMDLFIQKLDKNGNFIWAKSIGGNLNEVGHSIQADAVGNVYLTGSYSITVDFDPGPGIFNLTSKGFTDVFVLKLDAEGDFVWAKSVGGTGIENSYSIALDALGSISLTGLFETTADFDPSRQRLI